jgi:glycosyltransferase involved in cell wall biosynthesis
VASRDLIESAPRGPVAVSVGIPTCGRPRALERCLAGLAGGRARPREVIVIDQGPSDETVAVVARFDDALAIRRVEQARLGTSAARNLILKLTATPVIATLDDDCVPERDWLSSIAAALDADRRLTGVAGPVLAPHELPPNGARAASLRPSLDARRYSGRTYPALVGTGGNLAVRTDVVRALGGWDERLGPGSPGRAAEDLEFIDRLMATGAVVGYEPRAVVRHDWHLLEHRSRARWNYRFGFGAVVGMRLAQRDRFAVRLLTGYLRDALAVPDDPKDLFERTWTLAGLVPGMRYGWRCGRSVA